MRRALFFPKVSKVGAAGTHGVFCPRSGLGSPFLKLSPSRGPSRVRLCQSFTPVWLLVPQMVLLWIPNLPWVQPAGQEGCSAGFVKLKDIVKLTGARKSSAETLEGSKHPRQVRVYAPCPAVWDFKATQAERCPAAAS